MPANGHAQACQAPARRLQRRIWRWGLAAVALLGLAVAEQGVSAWARARQVKWQGAAILQEVARFLEACTPREAGTPEGRQAAAYLAEALGTRAQIRPFTSGLGLEMANVYLPYEGKPVAILASHFDTKRGIEGFVGANDGASTVGLLLHLAKTARLPVDYLFLDGEECRVKYSGKDGLQGAWQAAREGQMPRVPVVVVDMLGDAAYSPAVAENGSPRLKALVRRAAQRAGIALGTEENIIDDHVPFMASGWAAVNLIDFDYAYWHTPEDTLDKLSAEALGRSALLVREIVNLLAKESL